MDCRLHRTQRVVLLEDLHRTQVAGSLLIAGKWVTKTDAYQILRYFGLFYRFIQSIHISSFYIARSRNGLIIHWRGSGFPEVFNLLGVFSLPRLLNFFKLPGFFLNGGWLVVV